MSATRTRVRAAMALVAVAALTLAACGDDGPPAAAPGTTPGTVPGTTTVTTLVAELPDGGWLGGEPEWTDDDRAWIADEEAAEGGAARSDAPGVGPLVASGDAVSEGLESGPVEPGPDPLPPTTAGPLRAGSVDDNADFERFLEYLGRITALGIPLREFDPSGRIVVRVVGSDGLPVSGAEVVVTDEGGEVARVRTTANGTARFHPLAHGSEAGSFGVAVGSVAASATTGSEVELVMAEPGGATPPIALDVLFLLDATGSMGDEIDQLKSSIDSVADRVSALEGAPDVRFAMTLYRDEGDAFVTATHDFTSDVAAFRAALADVVADGGGDSPEALDEGLAEALSLPAWRDPSQAVQLVFLVADAPPQIARQVAVPYTDSIREAAARGIKIFPVASSESDDQAEAVFRQLAQATGARFVFLAYGAAGAATGGSTDIDRTDYEELALDDLVVRLVAEDLASLTGDPTQVPPPASTTTTVPEGQ
jgi:hypothetical protein